jgi:superfamily II DNA or RNA helicase
MKLHKYQERIVEELIFYKRWGLFADVGTGKTAMVISSSDKLDLPTLVITNKSLKTNWWREIGMWSSKKELFTVIHKEEFKRDYQTLPYYPVIAWDEAHSTFYTTNGFHKALDKYIAHHNPPYVWLATATPILSDVFSVWGASKLLRRLVMSYGAFSAKFFSQVRMGMRVIPVQKKNIEGEMTKLLRSFGSVVSNEENNLPDKIHEYEHFDLTKEQIKAIRLLDEDPTTVTPIVYHTKCLQIANGTLKVSDTEYKEIPSDKLARTLELVEQYPNCVIACRQKAELKMLHSKIKDSYIYDGDTPMDKRDEYIQIVNSGKGVLLLQADSGIGFNLQGVNLMIIYSHTWDFVKYAQLLGRIHRQGQTRKCTYIHLVTRGTIDENVVQCLERKDNGV